MDVRTCRRCGRLFNYMFGTNLCAACKNTLEKDYERTRDYIRDNPGASIKEVSDECEVTINQIEQWLRDGRLEFSKASGVNITCENCGKPVKKGRYCEECTNSMLNTLNSMMDKTKKGKEETSAPKDKSKSSSNKMRFLRK
ncbi:MAG: flagellar protein [Lachnospiraceae bacterium]|nr:flagellar protein [Lachnospiraceae bacterium]